MYIGYLATGLKENCSFFVLSPPYLEQQTNIHFQEKVQRLTCVLWVDPTSTTERFKKILKVTETFWVMFFIIIYQII